jgi:hypothetical protein
VAAITADVFESSMRPRRLFAGFGGPCDGGECEEFRGEVLISMGDVVVIVELSINDRGLSVIRGDSL